MPALPLDGHTDFVGKDAGFAKSLLECYESSCDHKPCGEITAEWDLSGLVEDTLLGFDCGLAIANAEAMAAWNAGAEFDEKHKAAIAARVGSD